ncbi:diguanylate cyclase [Alicycliphilus sp. B1]|nr:diguanylate cyclase [Alicycliphilus sp. B1]
MGGLPGDGGDCAIVQAIVSMGRALRIGVVAEGVETQAQRQALQGMGCDCYQGFLCAPAMPAADFRARMAEPATGAKRIAKRPGGDRSPNAESKGGTRGKTGVCECQRTGILNRGFRWARATRRWVHLTRDDHARLAMYQARAQ